MLILILRTIWQRIKSNGESFLIGFAAGMVLPTVMALAMPLKEASLPLQTPVAIEGKSPIFYEDIAKNVPFHIDLFYTFNGGPLDGKVYKQTIYTPKQILIDELVPLTFPKWNHEGKSVYKRIDVVSMPHDPGRVRVIMAIEK